MVRTSLMILILTLCSHSYAAILFEGYSKILLNGQHIGYTISRYTFDDKTQQFKSVYFLKTGKEAGEMTESLTATADSNLNPISFEYTNVIGKSVKTVDAKMVKNILKGTVKDNGKIVKINSKLEPGTFLSNFLVYLILKGKDGLKENSNYQYQAIAEEDGLVYKGTAATGKPSTYKDISVFKIENSFKDAKFTSWVTPRGEVLATEMPASGIKTELVAVPEEATAGQVVSQGIIKTLFGDIPEGKANALAAKNPTTPSKTSGVPQGSGIQLKSEPPAGK